MSTQPLELLKFPDSAALAAAAAKAWVQVVTQAAQAGRPHFVALSGGRIVRDFYQRVVDAARAQQTDFGNVHFFWGDERCVPPTDAESNFGVAQALLFQPLGIGAPQIHRIRGDAPSTEAVSEINREVLRLLPQDAAGQPIFDLIFLGLGEDAHVASLFPGTPAEVINARGPYLPVIGPKPPPQRITLSYQTIAAGREVWVLASGGGKEQALAQSLAPNSNTPLGRVIGQRSTTRIFTDLSLPAV